MIFNKDNNGAIELRDLTGSYFANNKFEKVAGQIEQVTEEISELITPEVYDKAEKLYHDGTDDSNEKEFIRKVQRPIAIMSTLRMYQRNDISHEDDGRKFKMATDDSEKLPWEWQLDRDDERHLEDYYTAVDSLIRYLNKSDIQEWKESEYYQQSQRMLIRSGKEFDSYFPINKSERTYILLLSFLQEVQILHIKKAYGKEWDEILQADNDNEARYAACKALALLTMAMALKRNQFNVIPSGVIRNYKSKNGSSSSRPASTKDLETVAGWMEEDGKNWINEMKRARDGDDPDYPILPENDKNNKYCRL